MLGSNRMGQQPTLLDVLWGFERDVPRSFNLTAWWHLLAHPFIWFKFARFFFFGHIWSQTYTLIGFDLLIEQLKDAIRQEITAISHEMTHQVLDNFRKRLQNKCVDNNGSHLKGLIFKT